VDQLLFLKPPLAPSSPEKEATRRLEKRNPRHKRKRNKEEEKKQKEEESSKDKHGSKKKRHRKNRRTRAPEPLEAGSATHLLICKALPQWWVSEE